MTAFGTSDRFVHSGFNMINYEVITFRNYNNDLLSMVKV